MNLNEAIEKLNALQRKLAAYNHASGLIYYDGATTAPKGSAKNRAESLGVLSEETYRLQTGEETAALLDFLHERRDELDEVNRRVVEVMRKDIEELRRVPIDEYVAMQKLLSESEDVWHDAKEKSDFAMFAPYLERVVATMKKFAGYVAP